MNNKWFTPDTSEPYKRVWKENLYEIKKLGLGVLTVSDANCLDPSLIEMIKNGIVSIICIGSQIHIFDPKNTIMLTYAGFFKKFPMSLGDQNKIEKAIVQNRIPRNAQREFIAKYLLGVEKIEDVVAATLTRKHTLDVPFIVSVPLLFKENIESLLNKSESNWKVIVKESRIAKCSICGNNEVVKNNDTIIICNQCGNNIYL